MSKNRYKVIFEGETVPGTTIEEVKEKLRSAFKGNSERFNKLFSSLPVVMAKDVPHETAVKYKRVLEKAGALCRLEECEGLHIERPRPDAKPTPIVSPAEPSSVSREQEGSASTLNKDQRRQRTSRQSPAKFNGRRYSILHPSFMSFFSKDFYRDVAKNWGGDSFLWLLLALALCLIPEMTVLHGKVSNFVNEKAPQYVAQVPKITISHGEVSIDEEEPYHIKNPVTNEDYVIIDTTGQFTSLSDVDAKVLITKSSVIYEDPSGETTTQDLSEVQKLVVDQALLNKFLQIGKNWLAIASFPFALVFSLFFRTIQVVIYAAIGIIIARVQGANLRFKNLISLAIMSITPVLFLNTTLHLANLQLPFCGLISFLIAMGYMSYGIKAASEDIEMRDDVISDHDQVKEPSALRLPQKYYLQLWIRRILVFVTLACLVSTALVLWFLSTLSLDELPFWDVLISILIVADVFVVALSIWRIRTPLVQIFEDRLKVNIPLPFKCSTARWDEIDGMAIVELSTFGIKDTSLKLFLKTETLATKEVVLSLKAVERPGEIVRMLKARIPERTHEEVKRSARMADREYESIKPSALSQRSVPTGDLKYKGMTLTKSGIRQKDRTIPWKSVREIRCPGLVIAGYPSAMISYTGEQSRTESLTIRPETSETYQQVVSYLLRHATQASIDPGLAKTLEYSPRHAKTDMGAIALFFSGIILLLVAMLILGFYSPTPASSWIYSLLVVPLGIAPIAMTFKLLTSRYRGKAASSYQKLFWSFLSNVGVVSSVLILILMAPGTSSWIVGDIHARTGNVVKAEDSYLKALETMPDNSDILFCMGQLYRESEDWERAAHYFERSFQADPSNWMAGAVVLLPDCLMKSGQYDEALAWCDRITEKYPKRRDIAHAISKKRREIERTKPADQ